MRVNTLTTRGTLLGIATMAGVAGLAVLVFLAVEVTRKLSLLETANSDNSQWTLAQAEVEFLEMMSAVTDARWNAPADLRTVRREFDVFYSRIDTLTHSGLYASMQANPQFSAALGGVHGFLQAAIPLIDADDATLRARLSDLAALIDDARPIVRTLSVTGLEFFARESDLQRERVATTLFDLALTTVALLSILVIAALVLARLVRQSERRANDLQRTSARLGTIVSTSLDAIIVADPAGRIIEFSPAAERIFGHRRQDVLGRAMGDVIVPEKHRAAHEAGMKRYRDTGIAHVIGKGRLTLEALRANGEVFPVELSIQSAEGASGEIFISYLRDISNRVAAERELVAARDLAVAGEKAKSEFLAVMSHEIRTPLNGLLGTLSLLEETRLTKRQQDYVRNMETSGALLLHHVNDVLDISKYQAGKMTLDVQDVDLNGLVQSVIDIQRDLASRANNVLEWRWVGTPMPHVRTDALRLRQVLINLVGNAVKFTRNGRIKVELEAGDARTGGARPVTFRVIDTGLGIDPPDIERMFRDFETADSSYGRQTGGTGLGLGIARRLTETLEGEIGATSTPGEGSVFWIRLPLAAGGGTNPAGAPSPEARADPPARRQTVLVVEDNEINRMVLNDMLTTDGHRVVEACDGSEGVRRAAQEPFDLILMDISMPVMDGRAATQAIRAAPGPSQFAPIVAVTAHALPAEIEDFRSHGMDAYLQKPLQRAKLRALLADPRAVAATRRTAPTQGDAAPIDRQHLATLRQDLGTATVTSLLARFLAEGDEIVATLAATHAPGWSPETARHLAHKLAGSAATFGAVALRVELSALETLAGDPARAEAARDRAGDLGRLWAETRAAFAKDA